MDDEEYQEYHPESEPIPPEEAREQGWDGVSEPQPSNFSDYDEYVKAQIDFNVRKASEGFRQQTGAIGASVADAVRAGLNLPPQVNPEIPDDPYRAERAELIRQSLEYSKEAIMCSETGKKEQAQAWRERQEKVERDLAKLPPPPEVQYVQDLADHLDERGMKFLMDPKQADNPCWQNERLKNDSPVVVQRANERAKSIIRLPLEDSPHGNPLACEPKNMISVEVPPDVMQNIKVHLKGIGDPDSAFRKKWQVLYATGYAGQAKRVVAPKGEEGHSENESDPNKMTFKQFCAWRESTGKKHIPPRMFAKKK